MARAVSVNNAWSNPSAVSPDDAVHMAGFLEDRARFPDQSELNNRLLAVVAPRTGERVLEVGSGSGVLCRMAAPAVAPDGLLVGIDIAPDMTAAARAFAGNDGQGCLNLHFDTGPAERLPYAMASFDAAFAARLLLHVDDRSAAVREMVRVVRPGGRVVLMDWDFESVAVDHSNRALTRRILNWRTDHHGGDNWSGRQLLGDVVTVGLHIPLVYPVAQVARDEHSALTQSLWRAAEVCRNAGAITAAEHDAWVAELKTRIMDGSFCASIVYFIVRGEREEGGVGYSVGIGLTNECNLECAHCYRDTERVDRVSLAQVMQICEAVPVDAIGMGTGENALHPEFVPTVEYLAGRGIKLSLASNGYSLMRMPESVLRAFHDVEVSIDFATEAEQDAFRGPGNWALVHQAMARCAGLSVEVSILATMMCINYAQIGALVALARRNGANLRVNAYQSVKTDAYRLSYAQFWEGYRRLFGEGLVVSCSEPVVRAAMGLGGVRSPCGQQSIRINPRGQVIPCVYWPVDSQPMLDIDDLGRLGVAVVESPAFREACSQPPSAAACPCQGGCASRRALNGRLDAHDEYCPWVRDETIRLDWRPATSKDLMRSGNVCTTIVV